MTSCTAAIFCRDIGLIPGPMLHNVTSTASDQPQDTATYSRRVLHFPCSGLKCQAWLYLPKGTQGKPPIVVAAHGLGKLAGGADMTASS